MRRFKNKIVMTEDGPKDSLEEHTEGEFVLYEDAEKYKEALALLYDKWENGYSCYEDPDTYDGYLGTAFKLDYETEEKPILELLKDE